eukprot:6308585-Prymnesium_polylepis.2
MGCARLRRGRPDRNYKQQCAHVLVTVAVDSRANTSPSKRVPSCATTPPSSSSTLCRRGMLLVGLRGRHRRDTTPAVGASQRGRAGPKSHQRLGRHMRAGCPILAAAAFYVLHDSHLYRAPNGACTDRVPGLWA